ncbi:N-acetyltransferase [Flavobacteriaceae bacterium D16]|nr:N-acetyltransferase [Flavobacteriaceae bacterium D16]
MGQINWQSQALVNREMDGKKRFELGEGDVIPFIEYIQNNQNIIFLTHTEVPQSLEGNGLGSLIVSKTLEYIRKKGFKMAPLCPFVAAYLKKHPEDASGILAPGYSIA